MMYLLVDANTLKDLAFLILHRGRARALLIQSIYYLFTLLSHVASSITLGDCFKLLKKVIIDFSITGITYSL